MRLRVAHFVLLAILVVLALVPATAGAASQVTLDPAGGGGGASVVVNGSGFSPSRRVQVSLSGTVWRSVRSSRTGVFAARLPVPSGRRGWLTIVSRSGRERVVNKFFRGTDAGADQVIEVAAGAGGRIRISPATLVPGATFQLRATGFAPGRRLRLTWMGTNRKVKVHRNGRFATAATLPGSVLPGPLPALVVGQGVRLTFSLLVSPLSPLGGGTQPIADAEVTSPPSAELAQPVVVKPANQSAPTVTGVAQEGSTLTSDPGTWSGTSPMSYAYQWQRCDSAGNACSAISDATNSSYGLTRSDVGHTLRLTVAASNAAGWATAASVPTAVVQTPPANTSLPKISGTAQDGQVLNASSGSWSGTQPISYAYQWRRCDTAGANCTGLAGGATYAVKTADVGHTLRVAVTATNSAGSVVVTSNPTAVVQVKPSQPNLVAQWDMDELSGSVMYDSAGTHNGTLHSVGLGVAGFSGTGYAFDGASSYVSVPYASDLDPGDADITITIHLKTTSPPNAGDQDSDLIRKGVYSGSPGEYKMEYYPSGQASCGFKGVRADGTTGYAELIAGPSLTDGQWHTIQCVKTSTQIKTIVDGQTYAKSATIGSIANTDSLLIGAHGSGSELFPGALDEASIQIG